MNGTPTGGTSGTGLAPNVAALLSYVCMPVTSIVFLLLEKDNTDVKFHAWQGTFLGCGAIAAMLVLRVLAAILGYIWVILGILVGFFVPLLGLAAFILWIVCLVKAYQGECWRVPVIGEYAAKKAGI